MIQQHLLPAGLREADFTPVIFQHGRQWERRTLTEGATSFIHQRLHSSSVVSVSHRLTERVQRERERERERGWRSEAGEDGTRDERRRQERWK